MRTFLNETEVEYRFAYDPTTGLFTWKNSPVGKVQDGDIAGSTNNKGYRILKCNRKQYKAHRVAYYLMTGDDPGINQVDHINHIRDDNRWSNLRLVDLRGQARNHSKNSNNTSGITGVGWYESRQQWVAQITFEGKKSHLGYFDTIEEASLVRALAEQSAGYHPNHGKSHAYIS